MFKILYQNNLLLCLLFSFCPLFLHADIFNSSVDNEPDFVFFSYGETTETFRTIDFNGDGFLDFAVESNDRSLDEPVTILINDPPATSFHVRTAVEPHSALLDSIDISKLAIVPQLSPLDGGEAMESLVLISNGGRMELIRYIDDNDMTILDRYNVFEYVLTAGNNDLDNPFTRIYHIGFGDFTYQIKWINDDMLVVADDGDRTRLFLFKRPFNFLTKDEKALTSIASYDLPDAPSFFWIGDIDGDEDNKDDVFFECSGNWCVWFSNKGSDGFSPSMEYSTFTTPLPSNVIKSTNVLVGANDYDLYVGVESSQNSDVAYIAFQREQISLSQFTYKPVPVTIPGKHLQGNTSRLFQYENKNTGESYSICIVYNPLDRKESQPNTFYIYKIDPNNPTSPQLQQIFRPEHVTNDNVYYFDRPEIVADFNRDGISDIAMKTDSRYLGYAGIASETKADGWSLH